MPSNFSTNANSSWVNWYLALYMTCYHGLVPTTNLIPHHKPIVPNSLCIRSGDHNIHPISASIDKTDPNLVPLRTWPIIGLNAASGLLLNGAGPVIQIANPDLN